MQPSNKLYLTVGCVLIWFSAKEKKAPYLNALYDAPCIYGFIHVLPFFLNGAALFQQWYWDFSGQSVRYRYRYIIIKIKYSLCSKWTKSPDRYSESHLDDNFLYASMCGPTALSTSNCDISHACLLGARSKNLLWDEKNTTFNFLG